MIKVYGAEICVDCRNFKAIQKNRGFEVEYIDMTENTKNMREFLTIRDNDPIFDEVKQRGGIGIPLFVREDGQKTFDLNEAMSWINQPAVEDHEIVEKIMACSIYGCK